MGCASLQRISNANRRDGLQHGDIDGFASQGKSGQYGPNIKREFHHAVEHLTKGELRVCMLSTSLDLDILSDLQIL